jgi:L-ornithine N5-monooxygenase
VYSVNEIFDPSKVDGFYSLESDARRKTLTEYRATNYGVVSTAVLERIYDRLYHQRLHEADEEKWQHRIINSREVTNVREEADGRLTLELRNTRSGNNETLKSRYDLVITGTGYNRNTHQRLLKSAQGVLESPRCTVARDYRVNFRKGAVADNSGVWLQGCCEESHGVSDFNPRFGALLTSSS